MSGVMPEELKAKEMPESAKHVWEWYCKIKNAGDVNYQTLQAFSQLECVDLLPNEVDLIMSFDREFKEVMYA